MSMQVDIRLGATTNLQLRASTLYFLEVTMYLVAANLPLLKSLSKYHSEWPKKIRILLSKSWPIRYCNSTAPAADIPATAHQNQEPNVPSKTPVSTISNPMIIRLETDMNEEFGHARSSVAIMPIGSEHNV